MTFHLVLYTLDVSVVVCAALLGARVLGSFPRKINAYLVALLFLNTICHVVLARDQYGHWIPEPYQIRVGDWGALLNLARNSTPGIFMILAHRLFVDGKAMPRWLLFLFAVQMMLEPVGWFLSDQSLTGEIVARTPPVLQALFGLAALYWTIADWRADLMEARRLTRMLLTIFISLQLIASILLFRLQVTALRVDSFHVHEIILFLDLGVVVFLLMRVSNPAISRYLELERDPVAAKARAEAERAKAEEPPETLGRLRRLLDDEKIYLEAGLTLNALADRMQLPEYRLRRLIHEELGFRNFNAFLHNYRIREACSMLRDPSQRRTPILTVALSVGYQSVNTFNRGFRETMGITPSEFRADPSAQPSDKSDNTAPKSE